MYSVLSEILCDKKGDIVFSCFGIWHLCYLIAAMAMIMAVILYAKKQGKPYINLHNQMEEAE